MSDESVVVLSERDLNELAIGVPIIVETEGGRVVFVHADHRDAVENEVYDWVCVLMDGDIRRAREGKELRWSGLSEDRPTIVVFHEDYAGTPRPPEAVAERMFERFKEEDGRARNVAQEALHLLGYEVEKDETYHLVEK